VCEAADLGGDIVVLVIVVAGESKVPPYFVGSVQKPALHFPISW